MKLSDIEVGKDYAMGNRSNGLTTRSRRIRIMSKTRKEDTSRRIWGYSSHSPTVLQYRHVGFHGTVESVGDIDLKQSYLKDVLMLWSEAAPKIRAALNAMDEDARRKADRMTQAKSYVALLGGQLPELGDVIIRMLGGNQLTFSLSMSQMQQILAHMADPAGEQADEFDTDDGFDNGSQ